MFRELSDETLASIIHDIDTEKARQLRLQQSRPANFSTTLDKEKTSPAAEQQLNQASAAAERMEEPMNPEGQTLFIADPCPNLSS